MPQPADQGARETCELARRRQRGCTRSALATLHYLVVTACLWPLGCWAFSTTLLDPGTVRLPAHLSGAPIGGGQSAPSSDDRPWLGLAGAPQWAMTQGESPRLGMRLRKLSADGPLARAGAEEGDLLLGLGETSFTDRDVSATEALHSALARYAPDTRVALHLWRAGTGPLRLDLTLGRTPAEFAPLATPPAWLQVEENLGELEKLTAGSSIETEAWQRRFRSVRNRHVAVLQSSDALRTRASVFAQLHPDRQGESARTITNSLLLSPVSALQLIGASQTRTNSLKPLGPEPTLASILDRVEQFLVTEHRAWHGDAFGWTDKERAYFYENYASLRDRMCESPAVSPDPSSAREITNRRLMALLGRVDRGAIRAAGERLFSFLDMILPALLTALDAEQETALIAARDTSAGCIEIWGTAAQLHRRPCAFRFDLGGDDRYFGVAAGAGASQAVSVSVDWAGNDLYQSAAGGTQGAGIGGVGLLLDVAGDDRYVARELGQGFAIAGIGLLLDLAGQDSYQSQYASQGIALAGAGVLYDADGADVYVGTHLCQGVGLAGGVGALVDAAGDDRYRCTGAVPSQYGDPGLFSAWGQGVGVGYRGVSSGGIGVLFDRYGDDHYEGGDFAMGGGYYYAWGIFRDGSGDDRYLGSRYAMGFAAHQAQGTFLEDGGNDVYASHSTVANGVAWDQSSVHFHDLAGDDQYLTGPGVSLATAAHSSTVLMLDSAGDDQYAAVPGDADRNTFHGGESFAMFIDAAGKDRYGEHGRSLNGQSLRRFEGFFFDLSP